jgi:hypothetical protein
MSTRREAIGDAAVERDIIRSSAATLVRRPWRLCRDGAAKGHHERIRQARSCAVARHEEVPGQVAPRYLGEARTREAPGRKHLRDHSSVAPRYSRPTRRLDAVSLPREPAPEAVHRAPVPFDPRAGRPVSHCVRAGLRRSADVCRRTHQQGERAGNDVRADRGARHGSLQELAGCAPRRSDMQGAASDFIRRSCRSSKSAHGTYRSSWTIGPMDLRT